MKIFKTISFELKDGIGNLILDQPPSNSMNTQFFKELEEITTDLKKISELDALIISGRGRHYSSGATLDELMDILIREEPQESDLFFKNNVKAFSFFSDCRVPVISAIRGVCIGSAMELALFSHFRFCSDDAVFGMPETTFNLIPGISGISHLIKLSGKARAIELVLRGNMFPAGEALGSGIVDRILPKKELLPFSFAFARSVCREYRKEKKLLYLKRIDEKII